MSVAVAPSPVVERVLRPFQRFVQMEAAGGIVLLVCTVIALVWANSPWAESYHHILEIPITVGAPGFTLELSIHHWINDALMAIFFFVVGLEIKREIMVGELASRRTAALPMAAALGGMVVPALLYTALNGGGPGVHGWGIPMATDIAFALGMLALLGPRVPLGLKVFLAALAIADDIGAVLVIAVFYTAKLAWGALALAGGLMVLLMLINRSRIRHPAVYAVVGIALWFAVHASGVHATVAGVLLAFTIPSYTRIGADEFMARTKDSLGQLQAASEPGASILTNRAYQEAVQAIESACEAVQAPLQKMEYKLHGLVAFGIMPLFALANAGVPLTGGVAELANPVALGVMLGLVIGKPLGITLASWLACRWGIAELPSGVSWRLLHGVAWLGGIGFTMSLFVAGLAFKDAALLDASKLGILTASTTAGLVGWLLLRTITGRASGRDASS